MTRVRFVKQWAVATGSDHKALLVDVELRRHGRRVRLRLCSINAGGRFAERQLRRLVQVYAPDVVAVQEASDQKGLAPVLGEYGLRLLLGAPAGRVGQAATPTFVGTRITVRRPGTWIKLLGAERIGKGAGPDRSKPKWWLKTRLEVEGIRFSASSWHATASQQYRRRWLAALREVRVWTSIAATLHRPVFTLGDTNSDYQQPLTRWILAHGMTSNHEQLGEIATHGKRSIDAVCVQRRLVTS